MGNGSAYNYVAMSEAVKDSGLSDNEVSDELTGMVMGSGGPSIENVILAADKTRQKIPKKMGPFVVPRTMASTASATLAVPFKIKGVNYTISSACATSGHCIGNAMELIQLGKQNIIFAGGSDEVHFAMTAMFDAMTALSSKYNDTPEKASRPYDKTRDGFVISGGGGVLVLEEYEHAKARGAKIYAEITGYGATSDGYDMVAPSGEGAVRCMNMALKTSRNKIDYINTHGTSTPVGDITELKAMGEVFNNYKPKISSTKSLSGHSLGATSVHEAIYSLIMMKNNFIAASANITEIDEEAKDYPIVTKVEKNAVLNSVMSNSFGVANERSIAWGIAQKLSEAGAELAFTYLGDALKKRVIPLAQKLDSNIILSCDVEKKVDVIKLFSDIKTKWKEIDFVVHAVAFSEKSELSGEYLNTSRENFLRSMLISCFSFTEVAKEASKIMREKGSMITLSYEANKAIPNYNVMGVCKAALESSVKYLARDLGSKGIRVNAISAGPIKTLAASAIGDAKFLYKWNEDHSFLRRNVDNLDVGNSALYLLSDMASGVTGEIHYVDAGYNKVGMPDPKNIS